MTSTVVPPPHEQLSLVRERVRKAQPRPVDPPSTELPVARIAVDVPLAHLDRPFDYLVPQGMHEQAVPGARVRVRFAGRDVDGFVLERVTASDHTGRLERIRRVVSPEPVLAPQVLEVARAVADRYAGTLADVLRLAVPPRHAATEAEQVPPSEPEPLPAPDPEPWSRYAGGAALLDAVRERRPARAVWAALPGGWTAEVVELVLVAAQSGRGALVVVPDQRDVDRLDAAVTARLGSGHHVALTAGLGPAERYRRFLAVARGHVRIVLGTRAAVFAPVQDLGLVLVWDDGDDSLAEQRSPYPHAREVCLLRATRAGAEQPPVLVVGGHSVTAEGALLVESGWAQAVRADRVTVRAAAPRISTPSGSPQGEDPLASAARLPTAAWRVAREALERGPVLVQVPRVGYVPSLSCGGCRTPARCRQCEGPLALPGSGGGGARAAGDGQQAHAPRCGWCGAGAVGWACPRCHDRRLRAVSIGAERTAEELGRAFPRTRVLQSSGERRRTTVPDRPALVVATPGTEPVAEGGYAAALLLDTGALLTRPSLRAQEEAYRRWLGAASLVRPAPAGGAVVVVADPGLPVVQALVRWDPFGAASAELADRAPLALPPTARVAVLTGPPAAVSDALSDLRRLLADAGAADDVRIGAVLEVEPPPGPPATQRRATRGAAGRSGAGRTATRAAAVHPEVAARSEVAAPSETAAAGAARPAEPVGRAMVRAPRSRAAALSRALSALQALRSARRDVAVVRVQVDPVDLA